MHKTKPRPHKVPTGPGMLETAQMEKGRSTKILATGKSVSGKKRGPYSK